MSSMIHWKNEELDEEWTQLILNARNMGFSSTDIRTFLKSANQRPQNLQYSTKSEPAYVPMGLLETT